MFTEDELLQVSALQHLAFCPRQWALIHLEGQWSDNLLTAEGSLAHENAHQELTEVRGNLRIAHALRIRSLRLGLVGQVDVVEFHKVKSRDQGILLSDIPGFWQPAIIEYKRGRPKIGHEDEVQLCAQALCLEEMWGVSFSTASFFYGLPRRRYEVALDAELRGETERLVTLLHELTLSGKTPAPEYQRRCRNCSLLNICLPEAVRKRKSVAGYLKMVYKTEGENEATP